MSALMEKALEDKKKTSYANWQERFLRAYAGTKKGIHVAAAGQEQAIEPVRQRRERSLIELGRERNRDPAGLLHRGEIGRVHVGTLGIFPDGHGRGHADQRVGHGFTVAPRPAEGQAKVP